MNLDAAIAAARTQSLERTAGSRATRERVLESCARSPGRRLHAVVAAVIASMFGASAFAWYARPPQAPPPRAPVIEPAGVALASSEPPVARYRTTTAVEPAAAPAGAEAVELAEPRRAAAAEPPLEERDAELALYATAHRLHFRDRDLAAAVAAWNRYLAAVPAGRLAPEARFNRLVALVRLERWDEAARELDLIDTAFRPRDVERLRAVIEHHTSAR